MTKKEEIQDRRQEILRLLQNSDREHPIALSELMERYDTSRRTIYDDIKALQDSGYAVENVSRKGFYLLRDREAKTGESEHNGSEAVEYAYKRKELYRKSRVESFQEVMLMITIQLSRNPLSLDEIVEAYGRICSYDSRNASSLNSAVSRKVDQLVERGYLVEEDGRYTTSLSAPVYLRLTEKQIEDLNDLILLYGQDGAHAKTLAGIAEQLRAVYEGGMLDEEGKSYGIGLHRIRSDETQSEVDLINRYAYDRKKLRLTYEGKRGDRSKINGFSTGLVIYASDKDRLYLIGRSDLMKAPSSGEWVRNHEYSYLILDVSRILEISEMDDQNTDFQSEEYMEMFRQMLVVDVDPPEQVRVEIEAGNRNLIRKFERHIRTRNEGMADGQGVAALTGTNGGYLYTDTVRGLEELARFLRQYGRSVTVHCPEELRKKMLFTAERALERYGVKENG